MRYLEEKNFLGDVLPAVKDGEPYMPETEIWVGGIYKFKEKTFRELFPEGLKFFMLVKLQFTLSGRGNNYPGCSVFVEALK
jgi:hypothetical protein